jgi:voltage-dependent potassium channel beta subunit
MGEAINQLGLPRDTYCVSSKVFWGGEKPTQRRLHRKHVFEACHAALKRLKVDYLDLFYCHRPDEDTPIEETVYTMHQLIMQGKIFYWGTSEWSAQQIMEAYAIAREHHLIPPVMEQPQYNLFHRERVEKEYHRLYSEIGLGLTIWSPLAGGILSGKYKYENLAEDKNARFNLPGYEWTKRDYFTIGAKERWEKIERLKALSKELNITLTELSICWCLKNPHVSSVILGSSNPNQLKQNLNAIQHLPLLSDEVLLKIENILENKPVFEKKYS